MPHTSKVAILITVVLLLALKNLYAVEVEPDFVNLYTYTNVTIRGEWKTIKVEGAEVDFNITRRGVAHLGLKPLRAEGEVILKVDNRTFRLPVRPHCAISIDARNLTSSIWVNVSHTGCGQLRLYINNTAAASLHVSYTPPHSGLYYILATSGVFYAKTKVVVVPNASVVNNVFGEVMSIKLTPPPLRGELRIGRLALPASGEIQIDTWQLGAGNYTAVLSMAGVSINYTVEIQKARPRLEVSYRPQYTYGERVVLNISLYVGKRPYGGAVEVYINQSRYLARAPAAVAAPLLDAGRYELLVRVLPDRNITSQSVGGAFRVLPAPVNLDVKINGTLANPYVVSYGKVLQIDATARSLVQPQGRIEVLIGGRPHGPLLDTLRLGAGVHNLTVVFVPTTRNFQPASVSVLLYVTPSAPSIVVNRTFSTIYGAELVVPIYVHLFGRPLDATLYVEIVGKPGVYRYAVEAVSGRAILRVKDLPAGTYIATVSVAEGGGLLPTKEVFNIFVGSAPVVVRLEAPYVGVYGQLLPLAVTVEPRGVAGVLTIHINGTVIYSGNTTTYRGLWAPPRGGIYVVVASFRSLDPNYAGTDNMTVVYIDRARCEIRFTIKGEVAGVDALYVLRRYYIEATPGFPVVIYVNSTRAVNPVVFNETGVYNVTVYFPGDDSYYPCGDSRRVEVVKNPIVVELRTSRKIAPIETGLPIEVALRGGVGREEGEVVVYMKNVTYNATEVERLYVNKSAAALLKFRNTGVYYIYVEYLGSSYYEANSSEPVVVTVEASVLGIPSFLLMLYGGSLAVGLLAAVLTKKILKRGF